MPLTFGSVAALAAQFDRPVARIDPNDTTATLDRVVTRKVNPSAVANAPRGASSRQAMAASQPVPRPESHPASSGHGTGTSPATSRSATEMPGPRYQANVAKHRESFEQLVSESNKVQTTARLNRSDIPKRLGTGMHSGTVVWEPIPREHVRHAERAPFCDEVIDRLQAMEPGKSTKTSVPVVKNYLADIVKNRRAALQAREASVAPKGERVDHPAKFSMPRIASSTTSSVPPDIDSGHGSPVDSGRRSEPRHAFLQTMLVVPDIDSSKGTPSSGCDSGRGSPIDEIVREPTFPSEMRESVYKQNGLEHYFTNLVSPAPSKAGTCMDDELLFGATHSDYESDFSGSSSPSSPPGSPVAREPANPWPQAYAEALRQPPFTPPNDEVTWAEVYDVIEKLNLAIADENMYEVSSDAIELLQLAESYIAAGNISSAYDALMRAREGVTEIKAVQGETALRPPSPALSEPLSDSWVEEPTDDEWVEKLDDCLGRLKGMADDYGKLARGRAASELRAAATEMLKTSPVRTVVKFMEPAMKDLIHFPAVARPMGHDDPEGFWI